VTARLGEFGEFVACLREAIIQMLRIMLWTFVALAALLTWALYDPPPCSEAMSELRCMAEEQKSMELLKARPNMQIPQPPPPPCPDCI
jgi:hypothetical protein